MTQETRDRLANLTMTDTLDAKAVLAALDELEKCRRALKWIAAHTIERLTRECAHAALEETR